MGHLVIVGYRPKPVKTERLRELMKTHVPRLRAEGLVTAREPIVMQAKDGTFVEVFEWVSESVLATAHGNAAVQTMWKEFAEACDYLPIGSLDEARQMFAGFAPVDLG